MRVGMNPQKQAKKIVLKFHHRVIIVVFIPSLEGYYKDVLEVFKVCLNSVQATTNDKCAITVVNNASCQEVVDYLNDKLSSGTIDSLIHHTENIGKMDALIGAARGSREPLITLADVDILFQSGWQEEVENVFSSMINVASVSPIPCKKLSLYASSSTLYKILLRKVKFYFESIPENHDAYNKFLKSFDWKPETDKYALWPVVEQNGIKAILGSGHQVMTFNRKIFFSTVPTEPSLTLVGNNSEYLYSDEPVDRSGGMRLSTYNNYAYHMGNMVEDWMLEIQKENITKISASNENVRPLGRLRFEPKNLNKSYYSFKRKVIGKLFKRFINKGNL